MRMDSGRGQSAAQWIQSAEETELAQVFHTYGEERYARRIARAIVRARSQSLITTTDELARVVADAVPSRGPRHPLRTGTYALPVGDVLQIMVVGRTGLR